MKRHLMILVLMAAILFGSDHLMAQWIQTNGPEGGDVNCFTSIDTILFVGTGGGVFCSTNNGMSWALTGLENPIVNSFAVISAGEAGMNLFAGTLLAGVYRSTDKGASWDQVNFGLPNYNVTALAVSDTNLFAGTDSSGVFLSPSNGAYWIPVNTGLTNKSINSLTVIDTNLYAGTNEGLFISTNNGTTWNLTGLTGETVSTLAVIDTILFVGTDTSGVLRSTDNGANWEIISIPDMDPCVFTLAVSKTNLFVGTNNGLYLTPSNGDYWIPVNTGLANKSVHSLLVKDTDLFAGTYGGVFRSTNNGTNWTEVNVGLKTTAVYSLDTSGENLYAGTKSGIYRSNDSGNSWMLLWAEWTCSIANDGTNLYGGSWGHLVYSMDSGATWEFVPLPDTSGMVFSLAPLDSYIFAGSERGGVVRLKRNASGLWTIFSTGQPDTVVNCLAINGSDLFAGTANGVYLSSNHGENWTAVNNGLTNLDVRALAFNNSILFAGTTTGGIFRSSNDGASWTPVNTDLPDVDVLSLAFSGDNIFAGTWQGGVFLSTDNGGSWTAVNTGLTYSLLQPASVVHSLAIVGTDLYAGTRGAAVWRRPLSEMITSVKSIPSKPLLTFSLEQNYPNPFNPTTKINYTLKTRSFVQLIIYDVSGKKIKIIVNQKQNAGNHEVIFNATGLASGIYIYTLKAGSFEQSRKMILLH